MPSARDWIIVLYGRFVRADGGVPDAWISAAHLVALLGDVGTDAASARTALHRMKGAGFVASEARHGSAGYRLTAAGEAFFADGDRRVLERDVTDARWVLASFSVPESQRQMRYRIRSGLLDLGFGQESGGLLLAPVGLLAEAERRLRHDGLDRWVSLWVGEYSGPGDLADVVGRAWDLARLRRLYDDYLDLSTRLLADPPVDDRAAFVAHVGNVNRWREIRYADPGLPAAALPVDWPAGRARAVFDEIETSLAPAATCHYRAVREIIDQDVA